VQLSEYLYTKGHKLERLILEGHLLKAAPFMKYTTSLVTLNLASNLLGEVPAELDTLAFLVRAALRATRAARAPLAAPLGRLVWSTAVYTIVAARACGAGDGRRALAAVVSRPVRGPAQRFRTCGAPPKRDLEQHAQRGALVVAGDPSA
jgi:hypothetical protein